MADIYNTQYFNVETDPEMRVKKVLELVYVAMTEKGYTSLTQIPLFVSRCLRQIFCGRRSSIRQRDTTAILLW